MDNLILTPYPKEVQEKMNKEFQNLMNQINDNKTGGKKPKNKSKSKRNS